MTMSKTLLVWMALAFVARADDITTLSGRKFTGVTISRVLPDALMVETDSGVERVPFSDLSPELRQKYGYDPEKEKQYTIEEAKASAGEAARRKEAQWAAGVDKQRVHAVGKVVGVSDQGPLITCARERLILGEVDHYSSIGLSSGPPAAIPPPEPARVYGEFILLHYAKAKSVAEGDLVDVWAWPVGVLQSYTVNGTEMSFPTHAISATRPPPPKNN